MSARNEENPDAGGHKVRPYTATIVKVKRGWAEAVAAPIGRAGVNGGTIVRECSQRLIGS